jgi:hypothetical protein
MKIERFCDTTPNANGLICRQGRVSGVISATILSAILIASPVVLGFIMNMWLFAIPFALLALFVVPMMVGDVRMRFCKTNWILSIEPTGLLLNLRSYKDQSETDTLSIVKIEYSEITEVSSYVEKFLTPTNKGARSHKNQSLEIRLNHSNTNELAATIKSNRNNKQPEKTYFGFITVRGGQMPANVTLEQDNVLRILWRDQFNWTAPSLRRVLTELAARVTVSEPTKRSLGNILEMSEGEFNNKVLDLLCAGDRIAAIVLLKKRRGMSTIDAHKFLEELEQHV